MTGQQNSSSFLRFALWFVQVSLALLYVGTGVFKLLTPVATIAAMWPWAGEYPNLLRLTGAVDLCGGLGLILPALLGIRPGLTVVAALGVAALQVCAILFHVARSEATNTPFNFILLALAVFVFWARRSRASISPRK